MNAPLIVIAGPSGVGKTTLVEETLRRSPLPLRRAVTATSRPPRPGERPGVDYHYWTAEKFGEEVRAGRMLEHAIVHGKDYYGTPLCEVAPHREAGVGVLLVIDVQGAANVRRLHPGAHLSVFVLPPSVEALEARLRSRGSEDEEKIRRRLLSARQELAEVVHFQHRIVNDDLPAASRRLEDLIRGEIDRLRAANPTPPNPPRDPDA